MSAIMRKETEREFCKSSESDTNRHENHIFRLFNFYLVYFRPYKLLGYSESLKLHLYEETIATHHRKREEALYITSIFVNLWHLPDLMDWQI